MAVCKKLSVFLLLVAVSEAVWKPKGNMHTHESPEALFRAGDVNKDDVLDAAELKDFYTHNEDQYHGSEISKAFGGDDKATARLDTNKDGVVDASEFLDYASPAHAHAVAQDDFNLGDKNKDGILDLAEYKKTHYGKERVIDGNHDGFHGHYKDIDANGDGKITKEEWLSSPAMMDPFSHMDYNKDKVVTLEEFSKNEREHYHGLNFDHPDSIKHTKEAFDILDRNKDGKLTRAEDRSIQPGQENEYEKLKFDDDEEEEDEEEEDEDEHEL